MSDLSVKSGIIANAALTEANGRLGELMVADDEERERLRCALIDAESLNTTLASRLKEAEDAIRWALGEGDSDFSDKIPKARAWRYWWREELRRRAFPIPKPDIEG